MFFFTFKAELSQLVPIQLDLPFLSLGWIHPSLNQSRFFITIFHSNSIVKNHLFMMRSPFFGATPWPPPPWSPVVPTPPAPPQSGAARPRAPPGRGSAGAPAPGAPVPGPGRAAPAARSLALEPVQKQWRGM